MDFVHKKFWVVLPIQLVKMLLDLHLSPIGVVPQYDQHPQLICDYLFYGINQDTLHLAPNKAMQFGLALTWVLRVLASANPKFGLVYLSKIDISDGFYRMQLTPQSMAHVGILLPKWDGEE